MNILNHLAVIPDGNRRWAKQRNLPPYVGHYYGMKKIEELLNWWLDTNIKVLSIYTLSYENFLNRPKVELKYLLSLLNKYLDKVIKGKISIFNKLLERGVKVRFVGLIEKLPKKIYNKIKKIMEETKENKNRELNFLLIYGGRQEIINAIKKIIENKEEPTIENFRKYLWVQEDVDLIIRTGGYHRLSNLLTFQSTYAEIFVLNKYWPDFSKEDFLYAINWFYNVKRNFGH